MQKCRPVHFNIRPGKKYLFYVKKVSAGRYVSVATPDPLNRKSRKASKKLLCPNCGKQLFLKNDNEYIFVNSGKYTIQIISLLEFTTLTLLLGC